MRNLLLTMLLVGMLISVTTTTQARSGVVLADDYPYASIFLGMARRGASDYSSRNDSFPIGIQQMESEGYTAYKFPTGFLPEYQVDGDTLEITSNGRPEYNLGDLSDPAVYGVTLPHGELYELVELYILPHGSADEEHELQQVKTYLFKGAEWYDAGYNPNDVIEAQRFDRIKTHLVNATVQYVSANSYMPQNLENLEEFVGVERNPAGWEDVEVIWTQDDVGFRPGCLFVGWVDDEWIISINLGIEIATETFWEDSNGNWTCTQSAIVY